MTTKQKTLLTLKLVFWALIANAFFHVVCFLFGKSYPSESYLIVPVSMFYAALLALKGVEE